MEQNELAQSGLLYYFHLLLKRRWFIILNFWLVIFVTYSITLMLPKWYHSEAVVLPPRDQTGGSLMDLGSISRLVGIGGPTGLGDQEIYSYISILKSRALQEVIIKEFELLDEYGIDDHSMEKALKILRDNVDFEINEDGALLISVYDQDPQNAADMANRFIELLHEKNTELSISEASARRKYIERRLEQNKAKMKDLEDKFRSFQSEHLLLILPNEFEKSMEGVVELYATHAMKELERDIARETVGSNNPKFKEIQLELNVLDRKLREIPKQTIESLRITRDLLIQQKIFEMLMPLLEKARLDELRDTPTVLVLDNAVPAEKKARPKRLLITLAMGIVSLILSIGYIVSSDYIRVIKLSEPQRYRIIEDIIRIIKHPFKGRSN